MQSDASGPVWLRFPLTQPVMKFMVVLINLAAIIALIGLRHYAHCYHHVETEDAYQGLVSRGLIDEAKAREYAQAHNGWHPRERLRSIGHPDGFLQLVFVIGIVSCVLNSVTILSLIRKKQMP